MSSDTNSPLLLWFKLYNYVKVVCQKMIYNSLQLLYMIVAIIVPFWEIYHFLALGTIFNWKHVSLVQVGFTYSWHLLCLYTIRTGWKKVKDIQKYSSTLIHMSCEFNIISQSPWWIYNCVGSYLLAKGL
jgi:hypothetical protein